MGFGDFLGGFVQGTAGAVGERRREKRAEIQGAVDHKQALGKLVLEGLVAGRVRPEFGSQILGELVNLSQPRQPERGFAGFMGGQQMPQTPQLDTLTGGGWNQGFYTPQEMAEQAAKLETYTSSIRLGDDFRSRVSKIPEFIAELRKTRPEIPEDMALSAAMQILWPNNAFGVQGTPTTYWDPVNKRVFWGQMDMMRGVVDSTTRQAVPSARQVTLQYQDNQLTGEQFTIDGASGEILARTPKGVVGPRPPQMPFYWQGGEFLRPGMAPSQYSQVPGAPPGGSTAPQVNVERETLANDLDRIDRAVNADLLLIKDNIIYKTDPDGVLIAAKKKELQEFYAKRYGYPDYAWIGAQLGGMPTRVAPGGQQLQPAAKTGTDANGVAWEVTTAPPKPPGR